MTYHTGCDAHKNFCIMHHMDNDGAHGLHQNVPTDRQSINNFLNQLDEPTTMTVEAGCNWWFLYNIFCEHRMVSDVTIVDPARSKKAADILSLLSGYGRASNDDIDSEMLAVMRKRNLITSITIPNEQQLETRTINRCRFDAVHASVQNKNRMTSLFTFYGFSISGNDAVTESDHFLKVKQQLPEYCVFVIDQLRSSILLADQHTEMCQNRLEKLLPLSDKNMKILLSAPGIGPVFARTILSEIFDISYFSAPKSLINYAGLAPIKKQSTDKKKAKIKLTRHCNYYVKYALISAANSARNHPKYRRKYEQDVRKRGKMIAKLNLARRLTKAIYWMLTRQELFAWK